MQIKGRIKCACLIKARWTEYNIHQLIFTYCDFQCFSAGWRKWIASFSPINQPGNWCLNWWLGYTVNWAPSLWTVIVLSFQTHCPANGHRTEQLNKEILNQYMCCLFIPEEVDKISFQDLNRREFRLVQLFPFCENKIK